MSLLVESWLHVNYVSAAVIGIQTSEPEPNVLPYSDSTVKSKTDVLMTVSRYNN